MPHVKLNRDLSIAYDGYTAIPYISGDVVACSDELAASLVRGGDGVLVNVDPAPAPVPVPADDPVEAPAKPRRKSTRRKALGAAPENK